MPFSVLTEFTPLSGDISITPKSVGECATAASAPLATTLMNEQPSSRWIPNIVQAVWQLCCTINHIKKLFHHSSPTIEVLLEITFLLFTLNRKCFSSKTHFKSPLFSRYNAFRHFTNGSCILGAVPITLNVDVMKSVEDVAQTDGGVHAIIGCDSQEACRLLQ